MADKFEKEQDGAQKVDTLQNDNVQDRNEHKEFKEALNNRRESLENAKNDLGIPLTVSKKPIGSRNISFFKKAQEQQFCHQEQQGPMNCCIIHPDNVYKGNWELFITLVLLFTCIVTPARMAFTSQQQNIEESQEWNGWDIAQTVTDVLFLFDIIIIFNTALIDEDEILIQDRSKIACDYLSGWFLIDVVAIFPFGFLMRLIQDQSEKVNNDLLRVAKIGKLYKLVKLTKLLRILKIAKEKSKILKYIRQFMRIGVGFERLFIFIMSTLMFCHIITCLWVFMATSSQGSTKDGEEEGPNWLTAGDHNELSPAQQYLVSIYFVIQTITTVGYGDTSITNPQERMFCIGLELLGVIGFSFATGVLSSIISQFDNQDARYKAQFAILQRLYKTYEDGFSKELYNKLKATIQFEDIGEDEESVAFIAGLPHSLRVAISNHIYSDRISQIHLFQTKSSSFIAWICPMLKTIPVIQDTTLYEEGDDIFAIYFHASEQQSQGSIGFVLQKYNNVKYVDLDQGTYFGVIDIVYSIYQQNLDQDRWINSKDKMIRYFSCMADKDTTLLSLNISDLYRMKNEFQDTYDQIFKGANEQLRKVNAIKERAKHDCEIQLDQYTAKIKGNLLATFTGKGKADLDKQEEKSKFEVTCYSYQDLYKVRYETLLKHLKSNQICCNEADLDRNNVKFFFKSRQTLIYQQNHDKEVLKNQAAEKVEEMIKNPQSSNKVDHEEDGYVKKVKSGSQQSEDDDDMPNEQDHSINIKMKQKSQGIDDIKGKEHNVSKMNFKQQKYNQKQQNMTSENDKAGEVNTITINKEEVELHLNEKIEQVETRLQNQVNEVEEKLQGTLDQILQELQKKK